MSIVIAIDPGISGTGIAILRTKYRGDHELLSCAVFMPEPAEKWEVRGLRIAANVRGYIEVHQILRHVYNDVIVAIEWPEFRGADAKGYTAASRGDLFKLSAFIGMLIEICRSLGLDVELVDVSSWKGQLPKTEVIRRIETLLGKELLKEKGAKSHAYDAIGVGLYVQGYRFTGTNDTV